VTGINTPPIPTRIAKRFMRIARWPGKRSDDSALDAVFIPADGHTQRDDCHAGEQRGSHHREERHRECDKSRRQRERRPIPERVHDRTGQETPEEKANKQRRDQRPTTREREPQFSGGLG
jgi:hypothetical protein